MVESGRVSGKSRIRASTKKLSVRLPTYGRMSVSTVKWNNTGEYREKVEYERVSNNCPDEYQKMVESVLVPENGRIRESTMKW